VSLLCVTVCCSVLQCVVNDDYDDHNKSKLRVCSVLQCVAVPCSVLSSLMPVDDDDDDPNQGKL